MKKLLSVLLILALILALLPCAAFAASGTFADYSDDDLKYWYEEARKEMQKRGLSLTQELTLRDGKFIVGQDIQPGSYTLKCVETSGENYGDLYSSLGNLYGGSDSAFGGLFGSLGGMIITPSYIDSVVRQGAALISLAVNMALHPCLTIEEINTLVG